MRLILNYEPLCVVLLVSGLSNSQNVMELRITARQYGEVVLPDDSTGHVLCSLATKLSRCKEGMAWFLQIQVQILSKPGVSRYKFNGSHEFIPGYKVGCGHWRSVAVQAVSEPESCQGAGL
jgi:hypothetical protein